ncbi:hypothetical protein BDN72DRAFT_849178 [Pluteus cervinus]|uniref:Uncharacterized protein n=1 Tax=Pluteus cervinus TaxID=181527 RepID=A0ACD3A8K1_9AGAR|nr:hypothetical protein BDN72DRAFT_849178 [Pluteus cervinus]
MTSMTSSPRLPPELEYAIFLFAYQEDRKEAKNLALVSRRVFEWLIPHIFHIVILAGNRSIPIQFNETVYGKYGHHVRHLFLQSSGARKHLDMFPNVVNLAFWIAYEPIHLPPLLRLPLTRIATSSLNLFQVIANLKLTHLDLASTFGSNATDIKAALYLPQLTHLCVLDILSTSSLALFLERERCPELRVVISWWYGDSHKPVLGMLDEDHEQMNDSRLVAIRCNSRRDWEMGARGGVDMWKFAESVISSRNAP